jgi:hypothetical protein
MSSFQLPPGAAPYLRPLRDRLRAACHHRTLFTGLCLGSSLLIIALDVLFFLELDLTALLILPLIAVTACCGPRLGLGAAWGAAVLKEAADRLRWGDSVPWFVTPANILIWGIVASVLVVLVAYALEAQRLQTFEVQLATLRQTMVTVQDIVRNRVQMVTVVCDLLEAGITPQPRHIVRLRTAVTEMLALLDQLSQMEEVNVAEVATGIQAVRIDPPQAEGPPDSRA